MGLFGDRTLRRLEDDVIVLGAMLGMADQGAMTGQAATNLPGVVNRIVASKQQLEVKGKGAEANKVISAAKARAGSSEQAQFVFRAIEGGGGIELA